MYLNMEEFLLLIWKGSRAASAEGNDDQEAADDKHDEAPRPLGKKGAKVAFHVPHTAIFNEGRLESW